VISSENHSNLVPSSLIYTRAPHVTMKDAVVDIQYVFALYLCYHTGAIVHGRFNNANGNLIRGFNHVPGSQQADEVNTSTAEYC
jgi:hypothetical protein